MHGMRDFYDDVIGRLLADGVLATPMRILVVCGGKTDHVVLRGHGFQHVVISSLDRTRGSDAFAPFTFSHQDAERLTFADGSFDFTIVHSGLHHCYSPHRALLEMYRVARTGLLLFEPHDSLAARLGVKLKVGQEYENASVFLHQGLRGGAGDGPIPNFVYRFTEREIVKAINCYAPYARHEVQFMYRMRIPWTQLRWRRNRSFYHAVRLARPALKLFELSFRKQSNNFAALVLKPDLPRALHPWLRHDGGAIRLDGDWLAARHASGRVAERREAGRGRVAGPVRASRPNPQA